jgi:PBP1b-binding outer membrane lipoprotein LpoB
MKNYIVIALVAMFCGGCVGAEESEGVTSSIRAPRWNSSPSVHLRSATDGVNVRPDWDKIGSCSE